MTDNSPVDYRIVSQEDVPLRIRMLTTMLQLAMAGQPPDIALSALGTAVIASIAEMVPDVEGSGETGGEIIDQLCAGLHAAWLMHQKDGATEQ